MVALVDLVGVRNVVYEVDAETRPDMSASAGGEKAERLGEREIGMVAN